jgi:hypothetical protein
LAKLRDDAEFRVAIERAGSDLGLDPMFVEKDYWVTQVLRALHEGEFAGSFIFKGGTSLSKGFGLIERFSEDVDILVRPSYRASIAEREALLLAMTESVAATLGIEWSEYRAPGRGRDAHRADLFHYERLIAPTIDAGIEAGGVLLETGYAGGREPSSMVGLVPILCAPLGIDPGEFEDTKEFRVAALEPLRTLVEKIVLLHHLASRMAQGDGVEDDRCGRHYYDILRVLEDADTVRELRDDRDGYTRIVADVESISEQHYGGMTPRPEDGFAKSPAFEPPADSDLRRYLEERYNDAEKLMPQTQRARWPTFGTLLQRIGRHAELL